MPSLPIRNYRAGGGIVVQDGKILLLEWPSRNEVRLPKGHIDPGETPEQAAVREVIEESGYQPFEILADLGTMLVEFDHAGEHIARTEYYFLMAPGPDFVKEKGEAAFNPVWEHWENAIERLTFEAEKAWVRRAQQVYTSQNTS